ncbi:MAG: glycoside hydrolase family 20 zincin-like fold domain-containing protein [Segatella maculosa]
MKLLIKAGITILLAACFSMGMRAQNIIPEPQSIVKGKGTLALSQLEGIMSNLNGKDIALLKDYIPQSISQELNAKKKRSVHKDSGCFLQLICTGTAQQAQMTADSVRLQGYDLSISDHGIRIEALTPMGLFHALQTLQQLEVNGTLPYMHVKAQLHGPDNWLFTDEIVVN